MRIKSYCTALSCALIFSITLLSGCGGTSGIQEDTGVDNAAASPSAETSSSPEPAASQSNTNTNSAPESAQKEGTRTERVAFSRGSTSTSVKGSVKGYDYVDYVVGAKAGQTMSVSMKSSSTFSYFNIADNKEGIALEGDPAPREVTTWKGILPKSGDYYIRVYLVRAEARRDGKADFTLNIAITGAGSNESAALPGVVTYSCSDNLEIYATLKNGGDWIEVEVGDTVLRLNRKRSGDGGGSRYADNAERDTFWLKGDEARLSFRGEDYTCRKKKS